MTTYRNPVPTVDVIIEITDDAGVSGIVLIERKNEPRGWALPGGFVDYGEPLAQAAAREAKEETGLDIEVLEQFFIYSHPQRDPRQHTISTVYLARASGEPVGADDAAVARIFQRADLPADIVFDHRQIIDDYFAYRDAGQRPPASR